MRVAFVGPFGQPTGYGQAYHDYAMAMVEAGLEPALVPIAPFERDNLDDRYDSLIGYKRDIDASTTHVIVHAPPAYAPKVLESLVLPESVIKILLTTWETSGCTLDLDMFDKIVVPSDFCSDAFYETSEIIPHTFNPHDWPLAPKQTEASSPYTFYSILGWSERKNPIGLLKAYLSEFTSKDDVLLRLKLSGYNPDDLKALVEATRIPWDELPALEVVTDFLDYEELLDFHWDGDCFVTAARGEGWNLPAFEAALVGNVVIAPDWGGHREFCLGPRYPGYRPVGYNLTPAISPPQPGELIQGTNVRVVRQNAPSGLSARQFWVEPNLEDLMAQMRCVFDAKPKRVSTHRGVFEERFSYQTVGRLWSNLLRKDNP